MTCLEAPLPSETMQPRDPVSIRRVLPSDAEPIAVFYARLHPASRRRRFLGWGVVGPVAAQRFCSPDHIHAEGFVAIADGGQDRGRIVGHVCLEGDEAREEVAIAVADDHQGRGIGGRLLEAATAWAAARGIDRLSATAFVDNAAMLHLLASMGRIHGARPDGGTVDIEVELVPT